MAKVIVSFALVVALSAFSQVRAEGGGGSAGKIYEFSGSDVFAQKYADSSKVILTPVPQPPTITFDVPEKPGVMGVYLISFGGQDYQITKLLDTRKTRGEKYWTYQVLNSKYPVTITEPIYRANRHILKEVPDFRPDEQRFAFSNWCEKHGPAIGAIVMILDFIF